MPRPKTYKYVATVVVETKVNWCKSRVREALQEHLKEAVEGFGPASLLINPTRIFVRRDLDKQ